jgi:protein-S-isoprenylcysteine O-methyltransferase Ste14
VEAGVGIALAGTIICIYWYVYWKSNFQGKLLTDGPYVYVRHPLYSGFLLLTAGLAIALPVYETRFLLIITIAVLIVYIPKEEESLLRHYKQKYKDYIEHVPYRLIPFIY